MMNKEDVADTPYKGLTPYTEEDAQFFFGRKAEEEIITANLMASRLTVIYGPSGVGKSSVLSAGVAYDLNKLSRQNLATYKVPEFAVVVFRSWRDAPIEGLLAQVESSVAKALNLKKIESSRHSRSFTETLRNWTKLLQNGDQEGELFIVLDQFEEYFLYHPNDTANFAVEFPKAVNDPNLRANFLISIREDWLSRLDRFKGQIPNLFDNYLRIEHLNRHAATEAIEMPIDQYNRLLGMDEPRISIEPGLVSEVLSQLEVLADRVGLTEGGRGTASTTQQNTGEEARIQTSYLQLVMTRLWEAENQRWEKDKDDDKDDGTRVLRSETLRQLGDAKKILQTHLEEVMRNLKPREQEVASRVFPHLVTAFGTKIASPVSGLARLTRQDEKELKKVLDKLSDKSNSILTTVASPPNQPGGSWYEVFHDVLAPALLDWRIQFEQEREIALVRDQRVPRQKRGPGGAVRLTSHKARSRWFQTRASWPVREAPVNRLVRERARVEKALAAPANVTSQWECVGPTNIGGRITCLAYHPRHPERIWAGAAGGGVWHSMDAGQNWQSCWNDQDILNIGSLAVDPRNPDTIYCGTGEANLSSDCYPGVGLYNSRDAGRTWQLHATPERCGIPRGIGVIAIDPFNSKHLLIGGVGYAEVSREINSLGGMYTSFDSGVTWKRETFISTQNYWCHSIVFHPTKKGTIFATFTEQGSRSGIWRSTDGGKNWEPLTKGLPNSATFGRTSLAISPSKPEVIYAFAADESSASRDLLLGVFRSTNGGDNWKRISGNHFDDEGQISYGNTIVVHPTDPNYVICGGVDLHLTRNGGKSWRRITHWDLERGDPKYAHSGHHALLMPAAVPGRVYDANDGGLDVSEDAGYHWKNRSNGLSVTMFYDLDVAPSNGLFFGGGAQDNGTVVTETGAATSFFQIYEGDGGWIVFDPLDENHVYCSVSNLDIRRFRGRTHKNVSPPASKAEQESVWMCFITLDPSDSSTVFTGSDRVWLTRNDGENWYVVSPSLDGSSISAIEVAPANPKKVYVATENGGFFRSLDGGDTWSPNLSSSMLPGHTITRLESHPKHANLVIATVANFGHSHVFRTKDGGLTWEDLDQGQLPDVPHHVSVIPGDELDNIYVGNDAGVFVLDQKVGKWMNLTKNLPNAMVVDLVYHTKDGTLSAATYGRSIWRIKLK